MNIFFDVDYTIIDMLGRLRPHVHEVFQEIKDMGHDIYIWSGVGIRWEVVKQHNLQPYVSDCFLKPIWDFEAGLSRYKVTIRPDFIIDDHSEIVSVFGGVVIKPYSSFSFGDEEMLRVRDAIIRFHANFYFSQNGNGHHLPLIR